MTSVQDTLDFRRIVGLPRRRISEDDAAAWAEHLTAMLRAPGGTMSLRPMQAVALAEAAAQRGAFLALPVGLGKTLISYLAPVVMGATRPVLIVPAALKDKTWADFQDFRGQWREPSPFPRVTSLQELAPERGAFLLEQIAPDLIVVDECDELANPRSSAARRIDRYIVAHPEVAVVLMTGTPGRKSILNYWHLVCWALRERAPLPMAQSEAEVWSLALDVQPPGRPRLRAGVGPLGPTVESAREWYRARLAETPGVLIVDGDSCDAPLTVRVRLAREDPRLDRAFEAFLKTLETPDGMPVSDPLSRWRIDGQLGCGLYQRWNPAPPESWREARRAVAKFVRDAIARSTHTRRPLDTEAQVLKRYEDHPIVVRWRAIKDTYIPQTEAVWVSTSTIESVRDWVAETAEPGIVWSGSVEFGEACASALGLPYYGREGREKDTGRSLRDADPARSLVASWHANKRGFNLQAWARQLVVMPPQSAKYLEQVFGRSHRAGQDRHVVVDLLAASGGTLDAFDAALREAGFSKDTLGMTQKVLRADIVRATPQVTKANRFRWARKAG